MVEFSYKSGGLDFARKTLFGLTRERQGLSFLTKRAIHVPGEHSKLWKKIKVGCAFRPFLAANLAGPFGAGLKPAPTAQVSRLGHQRNPGTFQERLLE